MVNQPKTLAERRLVTSIERSGPLGSPPWVQRIAGMLHLQQSVRPWTGRRAGGRRKRNQVRRIDVKGSNIKVCVTFASPLVILG